MKLEQIYKRGAEWKVEVGIGNTLHILKMSNVAIFCNQFLSAVAKIMRTGDREWVRNA